ncbi:hypothetical protein [Hydrogenophaga crocea]|jgi:hypothetical protein|uniref:Uncharacterized protein n=1 Tax=Hydrogenophaga crocea TaxID=2716225 RepID=A0A6G8IJG7_9BURK|nr:hypothetical protein [Hydrogenophaga crocea]QIM53223.1 hypothetical protein G9Q37_14210 [Hydrogenophaga crocea]
MDVCFWPNARLDRTSQNCGGHLVCELFCIAAPWVVAWDHLNGLDLQYTVELSVRSPNTREDLLSMRHQIETNGWVFTLTQQTNHMWP